MVYGSVIIAVYHVGAALYSQEYAYKNNCSFASNYFINLKIVNLQHYVVHTCKVESDNSAMLVFLFIWSQLTSIYELQ